MMADGFPDMVGGGEAGKQDSGQAAQDGERFDEIVKRWIATEAK